MSEWAICSFPLFWWAMWANCSGHSPKMSDVSESLRSLTKNEGPWAIRSGRSPKMNEWANNSFFWANHSFAHFFTKNKWFAQKTNEQIPSTATLRLKMWICCNQCTLQSERLTLLSQIGHKIQNTKYSNGLAYGIYQDSYVKFQNVNRLCVLLLISFKCKFLLSAFE